MDMSISANFRNSILEPQNRQLLSIGNVGGNSQSEMLDEMGRENRERDEMFANILDSIVGVSSTIEKTGKNIVDAIENIEIIGAASLLDNVPGAGGAGGKGAKPTLETPGAGKPGATATKMSGLKKGGLIGAAVIGGAILIDAFTPDQVKPGVGSDPNNFETPQSKVVEPIGTFNPHEKIPEPEFIGVAPTKQTSPSLMTAAERKAYYADMYKDAFPLPPLTPFTRTPKPAPEIQAKKVRPIGEAFPVPEMAPTPPAPAPEEPIRVFPLPPAEKIIPATVTPTRQEPTFVNDTTHNYYAVAAMNELQKSVADLEKETVDTQPVMNENNVEIPGIILRDQRLIDFRDKWTKLLDDAKTPKQKNRVLLKMNLEHDELMRILKKERISGALHERTISNTTMAQIDAKRGQEAAKKVKKTKANVEKWGEIQKQKPVEKMDEDWSIGKFITGIKEKMSSTREKVEQGKGVIGSAEAKPVGKKKVINGYDPEYTPYKKEVDDKPTIIEPITATKIPTKKSFEEARKELMERDKDVGTGRVPDGTFIIKDPKITPTKTKKKSKRELERKADKDLLNYREMAKTLEGGEDFLKTNPDERIYVGGERWSVGSNFSPKQIKALRKDIDSGNGTKLWPGTVIEQYKKQNDSTTPMMDSIKNNLKSSLNMSSNAIDTGGQLYAQSMQVEELGKIVANNTPNNSIVNAPTTINKSIQNLQIKSPIRNNESSLAKYTNSRYA